MDDYKRRIRVYARSRLRCFCCAGASKREAKRVARARLKDEDRGLADIIVADMAWFDRMADNEPTEDLLALMRGEDE